MSAGEKEMQEKLKEVRLMVSRIPKMLKNGAITYISMECKEALEILDELIKKATGEA